MLLACVMLVGCLLTITACGSKSSYPALEKAFTAKDFTVVEELSAITDGIKKELEEDDFVIEPHLLVKDSILKPATAFIIEFKATDDLKEAFAESETLQGFAKDVQKNEDAKALYNSLVEAGYAKGNCLILPIIGSEEVTQIVKDMK